jgi:hypothetical protein
VKIGRKILITVGAALAAPVVLMAAFYLYAVIYYSGHDEVGNFPLPNGHKIHLFNNREWDVSYCLFAEINGPIIRHEPTVIAGLLSSDSPPHCTIHSTTNSQIFWVTPDTKPGAVLYVVDFESKTYWPDPAEGWEKQREMGRRLLELVNSKEPGYHLYDDESIGVKN